jgi:hypothetical protein
MKIAPILLGSLLFLLVVALLPLPLSPYLDFQVIYHADLGLLRGIPIYDHTGQVNMIAGLANVPPDQVYVLPFPYPPWYALATVWLAVFPVGFGVRLWFGLNLLALFASIWLMTDGWAAYKRLISFLPPFLFLPVLGTLFVGQYVFPVLLGAALWLYAAETEKPILIALAFALLTFKPHLGALILLAGLVYLGLRRDEFGRRSLVYTLVIAIVLSALGFLADPAWPVNYFHSLVAFGQIPGVSSCNLCASFPAAIVQLVNWRAGFALAPILAPVILVALSIWWGLTRREVVHFPAPLLTLSVFMALLANPYLLNYDFVLLLLPFFVLMKQHRTRPGYLYLALAYLLPVIAFIFLERAEHAAFFLSTFMLLAMLHRDARQLDVSQAPAYNPTTMK